MATVIKRLVTPDLEHTETYATNVIWNDQVKSKKVAERFWLSNVHVRVNVTETNWWFCH